MRKTQPAVSRKVCEKGPEDGVGHTKPDGPPGQPIFYQLDTLYSVTMNPCDMNQFILKPDRRAKIKAMYRSIMETCNCRYYLKLEFSEPRGMRTKDFFGPRLHFHGVIKFTNKEQLIMFMMETYHRLCKVGTFDIDTCPTPKEFYDYIHKQKLIKDKIANFDPFIKIEPENVEETAGDDLDQ